MPRSFPNSRKVYVAGSRPDLCVPMREIRLADSTSRLGPIAHDAVTVYDTSGPYTDPAADIDLGGACRHYAPAGSRSAVTSRNGRRMLSASAPNRIPLLRELKQGQEVGGGGVNWHQARECDEDG